VEADRLDGVGYGVTLTLRDCPDSEQWARLLLALFTRLRRAGFIRWHWVVEWQRRGVPHLHMAVYGPAGGPNPGLWVQRAWLELAARYGAGSRSQDATAITGPVGWLKYLSKHASRGVRHYQRQGKPDGWETTGRLWGHGGDWPTAEPVRLELDGPEFWRYRRMVRGWAIAEARTRGDVKAAAYLRGMLACSDPGLSAARGVSQWVPGPVALRMAAAAGWDGEVKPRPVEPDRYVGRIRGRVLAA
jgi:hypothetical protein